MTGTVELDRDGTQLLIRFPYREDLVALVKELPGRRWDPRNKTWRVPATHIERVYATFAVHLFEFAPEASGLLAGTLGSAAGDGAPAAGDGAAVAGDGAPAAEPKPRQGRLPVDAPGEAEALTISQLTARVRDGVRQLFPETFWVVGEVVGYDKSAEREHHFFQLAEKAKNLPRAVAAVEAALFGRTADWLLPRLAEGEEPLTLRDGIEIRALVRADFYAAAGRFQLVIDDIDPSHTLGKLALTREQILRELTELGLAERNRALPFPVPALRVGVLASPDSDGWNDFLRHLEAAGAGFDVTLAPIKAQGIQLKPSLLRGLEWFADRDDEFDVLCILRGGGSRTDLAWFDDREVAHAVARHPLKVLVGIGHQRDKSVLDAIAHSEKTPTAVAALLVDCLRTARDDVRDRAARLDDAVRELLSDFGTALATATRTLLRVSRHRLEAGQRHLSSCTRELQATTALRLSRERAELRAAATRAARGSERRVERAGLRLEARVERLRLLDPRRVLDRGYALARSADGRVLPAVAGIAPGSALVVQFRDGRVTSRVEDVRANSTTEEP